MRYLIIGFIGFFLTLGLLIRVQPARAVVEDVNPIVIDCDQDGDNHLQKPEENEECEELTPTPTKTPTPTVTPIATPSATPTPTNPPLQQGGGGSQTPTSSTEAPEAPSCTIAFDKPVLNGFKSEGGDSVTFSWLYIAQVAKFSITYGYKPDKLVYGQDTISSNSRSITINKLQPGANVWAKVQAWRNGCMEESNLLDPIVK